VNDLALWGRLVKSWATHLDYVSQDYGDQPPRSNWVNTTWGDTTPPEPKTITDVDAQGVPKNWCLPPMTAVSIPRADHTTVTLQGAVALTVAEFAAAVNSGNVTITMPAQYKNVIIVQGGTDTIVFRLPPKDVAQGSEDDLLNGVSYNIPTFYNDLYAGQMPTTMPQCQNPQDPGKGAVMELHANRIGEYTLNSCS
jgi:hypothetical protein